MASMSMLAPNVRVWDLRLGNFSKNLGFKLWGTLLGNLRHDGNYGGDEADSLALTGHEVDAGATQVRATVRCNTLLLPVLDCSMMESWCSRYKRWGRMNRSPYMEAALSLL